MKKLMVLLASVFILLSVSCATTPQRSPEIKITVIDVTVQFENLKEEAQKEAAKLGYGPGDTVRIINEGGKARIVPKK
jgi:hypothetical protein